MPLQVSVEVPIIAPMSERIPVSIASRKGLSRVIAAAETERVLLTSHGRVVAVIDTAERLDEDLRRIREAADAILESAVALAADNAGKRWDLDATCARLGIDRSRVEERAAAFTA